MRDPHLQVAATVLAFLAGSALFYVLAGPFSATLGGRLRRQANAYALDIEQAFLRGVHPWLMVVTKNLGAPLGGVLALVLSQSIVYAGVTGLLLYHGPGWLLKYQVRRRREKLEGQVLDLITSVTTTLRSGMNLRQSIDEVAERMPTPMREEFELVRRQLDAGTGLKETLVGHDARVSIPKLTLVLHAILISEERGGDLIRLLDRIFVSLQQIEKVEDRIKTETSGVRLTARLMAMMPLLVCLLLYFASPTHVLMLFETLPGNLVLLVAAALDYVGFTMIRKLSELEV